MSWTPSQEFARHAPALVCQVAWRILQLRELQKELEPYLQVKIRPLTGPLPFEEKLLSGVIGQFDSIASPEDQEAKQLLHELVKGETATGILGLHCAWCGALAHLTTHNITHDSHCPSAIAVRLQKLLKL